MTEALPNRSLMSSRAFSKASSKKVSCIVSSRTSSSNETDIFRTGRPSQCFLNNTRLAWCTSSLRLVGSSRLHLPVKPGRMIKVSSLAADRYDLPHVSFGPDRWHTNSDSSNRGTCNSLRPRPIPF